MRKIAVFSVIVTIFIIFTSSSQNRNLRIGYIDMEYILQNVPEYIDARNQLEQKAQKWKQQIEEKKLEIIDLKKSLETERILLTKELIEEREEEIATVEKELLEYQEKRFGPTGDLIMQKTVLVKPIQDQIFTVVQDIAEAKKYDFIFDKSSDLTILFALKKYDISNQIVRAIVSSSKRDRLSKKELQELYEQEEKLEENPAMAERQKILDERKAEREKKIAEKREEQEKKKKELEEARLKLIAEKEATKVAKNKNKQSLQETAEERKRKQEERKQKILEAREAAKQQQLKEQENNK